MTILYPMFAGHAARNARRTIGCPRAPPAFVSAFQLQCQPSVHPTPLANFVTLIH